MTYILQVLNFGFNVPLKGMPLPEAMEKLKPLMIMVFYCVDKIKRFRLSKEGKFVILWRLLSSNLDAFQ